MAYKIITYIRKLKMQGIAAERIIMPFIQKILIRKYAVYPV